MIGGRHSSQAPQRDTAPTYLFLHHAARQAGLGRFGVTLDICLSLIVTFLFYCCVFSSGSIPNISCVCVLLDLTQGSARRVPVPLSYHPVIHVEKYLLYGQALFQALHRC